jgi:ArsR family metal-binding transcriptional regulator
MGQENAGILIETYDLKVFTPPSEPGAERFSAVIAFHPTQIAVSNVPDREAAIDGVEGLVKLVNRTWERRAEIEPSYEVRRRPSLMEVYKLLPRTNCKACGEGSCFIFANKLVAGHVELQDCPVLNEPQYAKQQVHLADLLAVDLPTIGQRAA